MNRDWSMLNKLMQAQLSRRGDFVQGKETLLQLRNTLMKVIDGFSSLTDEQLCAMPFPNKDGNLSATIAWSVYHLFRIEDIVVQPLIQDKPQVFISGSYGIKTGATVTTTGNELDGERMITFSRSLKKDALFAYAHAVDCATTSFLETLTFDDARRTFSIEDRNRLENLHVVDAGEESCWLLDFWCGKNVTGLLKMPLSRHWIMHVEASERIRQKVLLS